MDVITLKELAAALDRCMAAHPPAGEERRMHSDANTMADLWAPMVYERMECMARSQVPAAVLEAFQRWSST